MNNFDVFIDVQDKRWNQAVEELDKLVFKCKDFVLKRVQNEIPFLNESKNFSINLALSDDANVQRLNKEFRSLDRPTNVLSFANIDDDFFEESFKNEDDVELGDVIVAFETMVRESEELEVPFKSHFCHLWVHGMLHVLGYDHIDEAERFEMEAREIDILAELGIENPYQE